MARRRVPMLLLDGVSPPKKPPPQKPAAKAPARPAERRKAAPPPPAPPPEPKRSKGRQEKVDPKLVAAGMEKITEPAKPHFMIKDVNGTPPPPGTRGAKGPIPPAPHIPPKPPPAGTMLHLFEAAQPALPPRRWEIQYKCRVSVIHDTRDGTVVIEEYRQDFPEIHDPEAPAATKAPRLTEKVAQKMVADHKKRKKGGKK